MVLNKSLLTELINFRQQVHSFPELSGQEVNTAKSISHFISKTHYSKLIKDVGGNGLVAIYDSGSPGPVVLLRADIDALPIQEYNNLEYLSIIDGVAHLCGHDGHIAILAGIAKLLTPRVLKKGKVVLLFQPSEENGQGANKVINDDKFKKIKPDFSFALHNLPGFERGIVCVKDGSFASASTGMVIRMKGLSSHAAHPEDGNNPDRTMAKLILKLNELITQKEKFSDFTLLTVIHAKLGEQAFGTTPGNAVLMTTLRTYFNDDMDTLKALVEQVVKEVCNENSIKYDISYTEEFPATVNDPECVKLVVKSAQASNIKVKQLKEPFRWSEDFGHFTQTGKAALFGVGSGIEHPQLHNEDYDFPDEILEPAILVFKGILEETGVLIKES